VVVNDWRALESVKEKTIPSEVGQFRGISIEKQLKTISGHQRTSLRVNHCTVCQNDFISDKVLEFCG